MEKLLKDVLERILPTEKEKHAIFTQVTRIENIGREIMPEGVKIVLVGSLAKKTWLRASKDIDLFFLFEPGFDLEDTLPLLHKIADKLEGERELLYAQHPYLHLHIQPEDEFYEVDLVPGYNVPPDQIISAVDRSPYHTEFVKANLASTDEARLLKKFLKGIGCYGADMAFEGFSGYLCELLVIKFGSFLGVLKAASGWKPPVKLEGLVEHSSKTQFRSALVLRDPVDPERNVAAAVSRKMLNQFIRASKEFLEEPSEKFFFRESFPDIELKERDEIITVKVEGDDVSKEIFVSQVRALMHSCVKSLNRYGFLVERYELFGDSFALILKNRTLPEEEIHQGPPCNMKSHCEKFKEKWPDAFEEKGKLKVRRKREFTDAKKFLKTFFSKNLPNHIKSVKIVEPKGDLRRRVALFVENIPSWRY